MYIKHSSYRDNNNLGDDASIYRPTYPIIQFNIYQKFKDPFSHNFYDVIKIIKLIELL